MKSQVAFFVLLLLLVAIFNEAECVKVKNKRSVKGKITVGGAPAKGKIGVVGCTSEAQYVEGVDNYYDREATATKAFKTSSKGEFSASVTLIDDIEKGWRPYTLSVTCNVYYGGQVVKSVAFGAATKSINVGTIAL